MISDNGAKVYIVRKSLKQMMLKQLNIKLQKVNIDMAISQEYRLKWIVYLNVTQRLECSWKMTEN